MIVKQSDTQSERQIVEKKREREREREGGGGVENWRGPGRTMVYFPGSRNEKYIINKEQDIDDIY